MGVYNLSAKDMRRASKTVTFTGGAGAGATGSVNVFTVTGEVLIVALVPYCTTLLTEAAPTATVSLGVTGTTALFLAATNSVNIDADEFWLDTDPGSVTDAVIPSTLKDVAISGNVIITCATQNTTGGVIRFDCWWMPLSTDGNLVAA